MSAIVGMVIIGGISRIGDVTGFLAHLWLLSISVSSHYSFNYDKIGQSFSMIFPWP